jgi:hypothetical protein
MSLCSKYYKNEDLLEKNLNIPLYLFYCAKPDTAYIEGFWGATTSPYVNLRLEFTKCRNSTKNNFHCKNIEEINSIIQNGYLSLFFTTYDADPKNYQNPLNRVFYNDYNLLNANSSLEYSIDLFPKIFNSDDGLMFEDVKTFKGLDYNMRIFNRNTPSDFIFSMVFQGNPTSTIFKRSYIKFQTVLTQIGGFIKAIMLTGSLISMIFSKNFFLVLYLEKISKGERLVSEPSIIGMSPLGKKNEISKLNINIFRESQNEKINNQLINNNSSLNNVKNLNLNDHSNQKIGMFDIRLNNKLRNSPSQVNMEYLKNVKVKGNLYHVVFNYIVNSLLICSKRENRSRNYKLVSAIQKIYENFTSVEEIIKSSFNLKTFIKEYYQETQESSKMIDFSHNVGKLVAKRILKEAQIFNLD